MRGKGAGEYVYHVSAGITPAYAGKSGIDVIVGSGGKDHPRLCGEKADSLSAALTP